MPLSARKSSVSSQGLSRAYGSPVGPRTSSSGRKKPEWNDRATEDDKYKLTKDELLKKKKMYVSKHNVFASGNTSLSSTRKKKAPARSPHSLSMRDPLLEMTSLDYLNRGELSSEESDAVGDEEQSEGPMDPPLDETTDLARFLNKKKKSALKSPSSLRPPFSEKAQTPQAQRRRAADIEQGNTPKAAGATPVKREAPVTACKRVETSVGTDVLEMLRALYGELSYYEELSGRRSIFDFSELNTILDTYTEVDEDGINLPRKHVSIEGVVRYLIQLVCQSMTYLLQSEVKLSQQQTDYDSLSKRVEVLTALVTSGHVLNGEMKPSMTLPREREEWTPPGPSKDMATNVALTPTFVFGAPSPVVEKLITPTRFETPSADSSHNTPMQSQLSQRLGTASSDWLFASPLPRVQSAEYTESERINPDVQTKELKHITQEKIETMTTPTDSESTGANAAADKTFDLFGRERIMRTPVSVSSASPAFHKANSQVRFELAENSTWTPKVSGRSIQSEHLANSYEKHAESNYYFDMLQMKNEEDETDKMYQDNLISVARKLYAESVERSNLEDSDVTAEFGQYIPQQLQRTPTPATRVERLQKSLLANRYAQPYSSTFLTDIKSSFDGNVGSRGPALSAKSGWSVGTLEQASFGSIPPPPPPAPHSAPVHPYRGDVLHAQPPRHVFDATSGCY